MTNLLLEIKKLEKVFSTDKSFFRRGSDFKAVNNVSFSIKEGKTYGLIGESGSGKTTIGRMVLRLIEPTNGDILYKGESLLRVSKKRMRELRREVQIVFQDSGSAFNPRRMIGEQIGEVLKKYDVKLDSQQVKEEVLFTLQKVGLRNEFYDRYPHELSGGQRQRAGIARALILKPKFLVLDEPVSALDVSVKAQIINLLIQLQKEYGLTYLFIAHNLDLVAYFCDEVAVLSKGKIIEQGITAEIFKHPKHEITRKLLGSILMLDGSLNDTYEQSAI